MGFRDTSLLYKIVLILLVLCLCIDLIGFAISYWISVDDNATKINVGIWPQCTERNGAKQCAKISDSNITAVDWFRAVHAFSILSWVFFLVALVLIIIFVLFNSNMKALYVGAVCLSFAGAVCALVAFAAFAGQLKLMGYDAGYALTISFILGLIIGILGMLDCLWAVGSK